MEQEGTTGQPFAGDLTIVDYLYRIAGEYAEKTAVFMADVALTYRELNQRSNQLAHYLRQQGVGEDSVVAILLPRGMEMLIAIFGIVKAGGPTCLWHSVRRAAGSTRCLTTAPPRI